MKAYKYKVLKQDIVLAVIIGVVISVLQSYLDIAFFNNGYTSKLIIKKPNFLIQIHHEFILLMIEKSNCVCPINNAKPHKPTFSPL